VAMSYDMARPGRHKTENNKTWVSISNRFMSLKSGKSLMVVLRVKGSIIVSKEALCKFKGAATTR